MSEGFSTEGMLDIFLYESEQLLENMEQTVLASKDADAFDENEINEIFRCMHTIKGSAGVMMYDNIMHTAHGLEDIFYYIRETENIKEPHLELVEIVFRVMDFITGELEKIKSGDEPDGDSTELLKDLKSFLETLKSDVTDSGGELPPEQEYEAPTQFYLAPADEGNESKFYKISISYRADTDMCNIRAYSAVYALKDIAEDLLYMPEDIITNEDSSKVILAEGFHMLLQTKSEKADVEKLIDASGVEGILINACDAKDFAKGFSEESILTEADAKKEEDKEKEKAGKKEPALGDYVIKSREPGKAKELVKNQKGKKEQVKQAFMSVNVEKMDQLMTLMGEMVIAESAVLQNPEILDCGLELPEFKKAARQLTKITSEMQEIIMSMRMMPLTNTFQKMNRTVFDVSRKLGKDIEFEMVGETTEVDKNVIEHISDPLLHLVRNSVDHGIESNEDRKAAGKEEKGKVILEARNEGGKVWITVKDNGKGLNRKVIFKKAKEKGLIDPYKSIDEYSDKEIFNFITLPGFSTKEKVTEYSGRGVGMDVVMKNIQEIGGRLDIESEEGKGSSMIIKIPLTLAIVEGIKMRVGDSVFIVETSAVQEFIRVQEDMMITEPDGREYVMLRGDAYPVIRLHKFYHIDKKAKNGRDDVMIIVKYEEQAVGIFVDELLGAQEVVVKPIPSYVKKVPGLSGCTQLGDGSIALILDIGSLTANQKGEP